MIEVLHSYFFVVLPCGDRTIGTVSTVLYVLYKCPSKTATVTWVACCTNRGDLWYNRPVWGWPQCCCYALAAPGYSSSTVHTGGRGWHIDRNREKDRGIYCCCQLISAVSDASVIIASLKLVGEKMWEAVSWMKAQLDPEKKKRRITSSWAMGSVMHCHITEKIRQWLLSSEAWLQRKMGWEKTKVIFITASAQRQRGDEKVTSFLTPRLV